MMWIILYWNKCFVSYDSHRIKTVNISGGYYMKARLIKRDSMIQLLSCNGTIYNFTLLEAKRFLEYFDKESYYEGNSSWDYETSMKDFEGETIAYISDKGFLVVCAPSVYRTILRSEPVYLTVAEYAEKHGKKPAIIRRFCNDKRLRGAMRKGSTWLIPEDAEYPEDARVGRRIKPIDD